MSLGELKAAGGRAQPSESRADVKHDAPDGLGATRSSVYCYYVLFILLLVQLLNYADRTVLGVLAEPIKHDLGTSDAELGFLFGTSFVLFNGIMGIALGRVTDSWRRNRLLMIAIGLWSAMTALSGLATNFVQLAAARFSVGVGEATAGPTSYSLLADIFPPRRRGTVFAVYLSSTFLGSTLSLAVGGWIVQNWSQQCSALGLCALKGWQAAFLLFGLPGLVVAMLAGPIGEPACGREAERRARSKPLSEGIQELSLLVPPFTVIQLSRIGGASAVRANLTALAIMVPVAGALIWLTGDLAQWIAVLIAAYSLVAWSQTLALRDPALFRLTIASPTFRMAILGFAMIGLPAGAVSFWAVPLAIRKLGMTHAEAGAMIGAALGVGALLGNLIGGIVVDRWQRATRSAPLYLCLVSLVASAPAMGLMLLTGDKLVFTLALGAFITLAMSWAPGGASLTQDLVLPSMRGRTAAMYSVFLTLVGMSLGPYVVGKIADLTGSLGTGLTMLYIGAPVAIIAFLFAARRLPDAYRARDRESAADAQP